MSRLLLLLCILLVTPAVQADWPYEFIHITCHPKENYFEAREVVLYGLDDIQSEFDKEKREDNARAYAKNKSLYLVAGYKQRMSCTLSDGTRIGFSTNPNPEDEHNILPGANATLVINEQTLFADLSFPTDCERTLTGVIVDKTKGEFVRLVMRSNVDYKPFTDLPTEATIGINSIYDSAADALRIRNCRSPNSGQR